MLTSIRGLVAANLAAGLALSATPAFAETIDFDAAQSVEPAPEVSAELIAAVSEIDLDRALAEVDTAAASKIGDESGLEFSGNVALVSEYRFRGVDLSGGDIAVQGGIDIAHSSGLYVGAWGSSLDEDTVGYGHTELDLYFGFGGQLSDAVSFDYGLIVYIYPNAGAGDFDYVEAYGSLGFNLGPAEATIGVAYAPEQDSLANTDNFYIYGDVGFAVPGTPLTITGHLGYTDGFLTFTDDGKAFDWSIGAEAAVAGPVSVGVAYVGAEGDFLPGDYDYTDDAIVFTISASI